MTTLIASPRCKLTVMLLPLLLMVCACSSQPRSAEQPKAAPRVIPPLSKAARQSTPSQPYLLRAKRNSEAWQKQLSSTESPASAAKPNTTP